MIEVSKLSKSFSGNRVVDNISFSVEKGKTLVLLGKSGCGKTTTLKMLNRLVEPDVGEIRILGKNVLAITPEQLRRNIGYVIQDTGLFPHYSIAQNIAVVPTLLGWEAGKIKKKTSELLEMLDLPQSILSRKPAELSGGQQQRVGIARALAAEPPVILLDEPFGALDPLTRQQIRKDFKQLETLLDTTMVMVTHDVAEAVELADEICLMDQGRIVQKGVPKNLVFNPNSSFSKAFFENDFLQLSFSLVKIKDLLPLLNPTGKEENGKEISHFSVQENLALVLNSANGHLLAFKEEREGSEPVYTNKEALLIAYQRWVENGYA
ncbi:ABC transporter ATP-binding protein [Flammeovirgaceae bacterium SG7u.111]|nr:ABC transporter ATP-binding protein [Flammeovirgaceae bacterium SG7u.132]WPO37498.1 ABC transporter ATP-binding protein [Flammeovirgaceae bacterium SG7u.111]